MLFQPVYRTINNAPAKMTISLRAKQNTLLILLNAALKPDLFYAMLINVVYD